MSADRLFLATSLPILLACTPLAPVPEPPAGPPADSVEYYSGASTMTGDVFAEPYTFQYLVRRSLFPSQGFIVEELWDREDPEMFRVDMTIDDNTGTLTLVFDPQGWEGTGTLTGEAWSWTGWETITEVPAGAFLEQHTVVSTDVLTTEALEVSKVATRTDGSTYWQASETFHVIDEAAFDAELAGLPQ